MITDKYPKACSLLWGHVAVQMNGKIAPCCRFKRMDYLLPDIKDGINNALNGEVFADIRNRMMAGEELPNCSKCWDREHASGQSMRLEVNEMFSGFDVKDEEPFELFFLETGFSTHCNLACRMCSEDYSSTWSRINNPDDKVSLGFDTDISNFDMDLSKLREMKFVGGEPMMARQHAEFVDELLSAGTNLSKLRVTYHTNGTVKPSQQIVDFWKKLGQVRIVISMDGVGRVNEIIRPGHKWEDFEEVLDFYLALSDTKQVNMALRFHTVVTPMNVFKIEDNYKYALKKIGGMRISLDMCENPPELCIRHMPQPLKDKAKRYISESKYIPDNRKKMLLGELNIDSDKLYTTEDIATQPEQEAVDAYFKQNIRDLLDER